MSKGIATRLGKVKKEIEVAAQLAGRKAELVRLIAVSKTHSPESIAEAIAAGQVDFGENRVQELVQKQLIFPDVHWHMIGSLQRNKVKYIAEFIHLIHSVDSKALLEEINKQGKKYQRQISCLLQINISDEEQKSGMDENEAEEILKTIEIYPHIKILGLMGMAAMDAEGEQLRHQFKRLFLASEKFRGFENAQIKMQELSMGMSGDFPIAIAEGATMVRVGSSIFGHR